MRSGIQSSISQAQSVWSGRRAVPDARICARTELVQQARERLIDFSRSGAGGRLQLAAFQTRRRSVEVCAELDRVPYSAQSTLGAVATYHPDVKHCAGLLPNVKVEKTFPYGSRGEAPGTVEGHSERLAGILTTISEIKVCSFVESGDTPASYAHVE